jgi:hypothetical protein
MRILRTHGFQRARSRTCSAADDAGAVALSGESRDERLGNLGWGEWDLRSGETTHSDQLYAILGRDPADGPVSMAEFTALVVPDDRPAVEAALDTLFREGEPLDLRFRLASPAGVRHVRSIADVTRDATGRAVKLYGAIQDVTHRHQQLTDMRHELAEHQRTLEDEQRLAVELQRIILPSCLIRWICRGSAWPSATCLPSRSPTSAATGITPLWCRTTGASCWPWAMSRGTGSWRRPPWPNSAMPWSPCRSPPRTPRSCSPA